MSDRFDFEQQILKCWNITDDLKEVSEHFMNYHDANFSKDKVSNSLIGLSELYDIKFNKLWDLFEDVVMDLVRENKMLTEECVAMREQLESAYDGQGYGIAAIKPKIQEAPFPPDNFTREEAKMAVIKAKKKGKTK